MVVAVYRNLSGELRTAFTNVLDPRLVGLLQENLQPIQQELTSYQRASDDKYKVLSSKIQQQNLSLDVAIETIKLHITNATKGLETESSALSAIAITRPQEAASIADEESNALSQSLELMQIASTNPELKESLQEM
jgi:hypothetical protein